MTSTNRPRVILVVLDGWGIGEQDATNPIFAAGLKNIDFIRTNFPIGSLQASGISVGLPWNEEGNSEIGHLTIGAGRIVYQTAVKIDITIDDGSFFKNPILTAALQNAKSSGRPIHLSGLIGTGMTHSDFRHLLSLIKLCELNSVDYVLHLFTDGRDSPPKTALNLLDQLDQSKIGSLSGRFYAMDRDSHLDRVELAFKAMTGATKSQSISPSEYIKKSYDAGIASDENIIPASFNQESLSVKPDDSIIFFNFRADRMRELSRMFSDKTPSIKITSFTQYDVTLPIPFVFSFEPIKNSLSEIVSANNLTQLRIAESEKRAHVTYFFNGETEAPYQQEFRIIIPSRNISDHSKHPEMMAQELATRAIAAIEENSYEFILVNFANPDIIAHTGDFEATVKAVQEVDREIGLIGQAALNTGATLIITSDHGNAEKLIDTRTGEKDTRHNASPVPFYIVDRRFPRPKSLEEASTIERFSAGTLCDIAPTILELMEIKKPEEMTGQNLLPYLS